MQPEQRHQIVRSESLSQIVAVLRDLPNGASLPLKITTRFAREYCPFRMFLPASNAASSSSAAYFLASARASSLLIFGLNSLSVINVSPAFGRISPQTTPPSTCSILHLWGSR